jgi:EAL domain-containing protein (putative c-di-GMP-specific phosphodiesterase class I)
MARYGLEPDRIVVEITERMIARGEDEIIAAAMRLRERNISVAIDDFGTGQSSFLRLRDFEFNILKIDQSFVQGIGDDRSGGVVTSLLGMAHDLGTTSLAEGIENAGQLRFLLDGGCQLVQGFHLGLPTPAQEFQSVVARSLEAHNTDNVRQGAPPDERFGGLPQFPTNKPGFAGGY